MYYTSNNAGFLTVLLGDGTGQFASAPFPPVQFSGTPEPLVAADFNGDGKLDLAVLEGSKIHILTNVGGGNFVDALDLIADFYLTSLLTGDFNGDGKLDLVLAGDDANVFPATQVLLGDGAGNFNFGPYHQISQVEAGVGSAAAGDFNEDGKLDLAVSDLANDGLTILLGDGVGNFTPVASPTTGNITSQIALGDFNGSGCLDFAVASCCLCCNDALSIFFDPASPPSALDVTSSFSIVSTGLIYSRVTQSYHGTITVTNTGTQTYSGPLDLTFQNLPSGVSLNAPSGTFQRAPYMNLPGGLAPGQSVSLILQFSDPSNTPVTFINKLYSGTL